MEDRILSLKSLLAEKRNDLQNLENLINQTTNTNITTMTLAQEQQIRNSIQELESEIQQILTELNSLEEGQPLTKKRRILRSETQALQNAILTNTQRLQALSTKDRNTVLLSTIIQQLPYEDVKSFLFLNKALPVPNITSSESSLNLFLQSKPTELQILNLIFNKDNKHETFNRQVSTNEDQLAKYCLSRMYEECLQLIYQDNGFKPDEYTLIYSIKTNPIFAQNILSNRKFRYILPSFIKSRMLHEIIVALNNTFYENPTLQGDVQTLVFPHLINPTDDQKERFMTEFKEIIYDIIVKLFFSQPLVVDRSYFGKNLETLCDITQHGFQPIYSDISQRRILDTIGYILQDYSVRASKYIWNTYGYNVLLGEGEVGLETDTLKFKVGDGKLHYPSLPYYKGPETFAELIQRQPKEFRFLQSVLNLNNATELLSSVHFSCVFINAKMIINALNFPNEDLIFKILNFSPNRSFFNLESAETNYDNYIILLANSCRYYSFQFLQFVVQNPQFQKFQPQLQQQLEQSTRLYKYIIILNRQNRPRNYIKVRQKLEYLFARFPIQIIDLNIWKLFNSENFNQEIFLTYLDYYLENEDHIENLLNFFVNLPEIYNNTNTMLTTKVEPKALMIAGVLSRLQINDEEELLIHTLTFFYNTRNLKLIHILPIIIRNLPLSVALQIKEQFQKDLIQKQNVINSMDNFYTYAEKADDIFFMDFRKFYIKLIDHEFFDVFNINLPEGLDFDLPEGLDFDLDLNNVTNITSSNINNNNINNNNSNI